MALLDIFDSDAFSVHALSASIEKLPFQPGLIGRMNLFQQAPVSTNVAIVEEKRGQLALLPTMERGSENQTTLGPDVRKIHSFVIPHVPQWDAVLAGDLSGKRAFGSETQTEVFSQVLNDRLERMKRNHEVTWEYHRLGAIKGVVLDANGTTEIVNWFTVFGLTQEEVNFNFYDGGGYDQSEPAADVKVLSQSIKRLIQNALGGTPFTGITALCGDEFFDALVAHVTVRRAYEMWQSNSFARELQDKDDGFMFAGIKWINYRGSIGAVDFIETDEAHFFPTGVKDVFVEAPAPADFIETVNTRGKMLYAKQERIKYDKGIELHTQSNVLYMCLRPAALIKGTMSNEAPGTGS